MKNQYHTQCRQSNDINLHSNGGKIKINVLLKLLLISKSQKLCMIITV